MWGLVPKFYRNPLEEKKFSTFNYNSRAADWLQKPTFHHAIRHQRCLIPATYFCEYAGEKGVKKSISFQRPDGQPFVMAGAWNHWQGIHKGEPVSYGTFTMLTTVANGIVAPVHPKAMPVLLEWSDIDLWLEGPFEQAIKLAAPCPESRLQIA